MGSLRLRLAIGGALAIVAALVAAAFGLALLFERHAQRALADDLDVHLRQLAAGIEIDGTGSLTVAREPADPRFSEPLSGLYWQAVPAEGPPLRSRSLWDEVLRLSSDPDGGAVRRVELVGPRGARALASARSVTLGDGAAARRVHLAVVADLTQVTAARDAFMRDLAPALALLGAVLALSALAQIAAGLAPLERLRRAVEAIRERRAARLPDAVPHEVRPVVEALNGLLVAQEKELTRARDRAADLAHGLKTPLAALRGDAQRLRERGDHETAASIDRIGETMLRHVERELARARARGRSGALQTSKTAARPVAAGLIATIARAPQLSGRVFENLLADDLHLPIDRDDLTEVLGNLLENAARHARKNVRISAIADGGLAVDDDGPGVPESRRSHVLQRGGRLDEGGGAGLGLAIVQEILGPYGWTLGLDQSPMGGLRAVISGRAR